MRRYVEKEREDIYMAGGMRYEGVHWVGEYTTLYRIVILSFLDLFST
jgi:hypothetical protein